MSDEILRKIIESYPDKEMFLVLKSNKEEALTLIKDIRSLGARCFLSSTVDKYEIVVLGESFDAPY